MFQAKEYDEVVTPSARATTRTGATPAWVNSIPRSEYCTMIQRFDGYAELDTAPIGSPTRAAVWAGRAVADVCHLCSVGKGG